MQPILHTHPIRSLRSSLISSSSLSKAPSNSSVLRLLLTTFCQSNPPHLDRSISTYPLAIAMAGTRASTGAGASVRVLVVGLLVTWLCVQAAADSTITNLSTKGKIYVFDKALANGKAVTVTPAKLGNVKISRELNGAYGLIPLKDRRRYFIVNNNGDASFPSDLVEGAFITSAF